MPDASLAILCLAIAVKAPVFKLPYCGGRAACKNDVRTYVSMLTILCVGPAPVGQKLLIPVAVMLLCAARRAARTTCGCSWRC